MYRIQILLDGRQQTYRYLDSIHGAMINGLTAAGTPFTTVAGMDAEPWTFACKGFAKPNGEMTLKSVLVSTSSEAIAEAMRRLDAAYLVKISANGDEIDLRSARIVHERRGLVPGQNEVCVAFASGFAVALPKNGKREKTSFCRSTSESNFADALRTNLNRRAGCQLDLEIGIDRLTLMTEGTPRFVSLRKSGSKRIMIPAFNMPITLRGSAKDVEFAFFAGMGAKANLGFGCPIVQG